MYTFTETELKQLLSRTIELFTSQDGVFDFSDTAPADTVEAMMKQLQAQAEDEIFQSALLEEIEELCPDCDSVISQKQNKRLCFECGWFDNGDNIHEAALGLQSVA